MQGADSIRNLEQAPWEISFTLLLCVTELGFLIDRRLMIRLVSLLLVFPDMKVVRIAVLTVCAAMMAIHVVQASNMAFSMTESMAFAMVVPVIDTMSLLMAINMIVCDLLLFIRVMVSERHLWIMNVVMLNAMVSFVLHFVEEAIKLVLDLTHKAVAAMIVGIMRVVTVVLIM